MSRFGLGFISAGGALGPPDFEFSLTAGAGPFSATGFFTTEYRTDLGALGPDVGSISPEPADPVFIGVYTYTSGQLEIAMRGNKVGVLTSAVITVDDVIIASPSPNSEGYEASGDYTYINWSGSFVFASGSSYAVKLYA